MGHRKKHAPKRGSLSYLPRGRASRQIGRIRYWPKVKKGPIMLGFAGYKAGMTNVLMIEGKKRSPHFGKEIVCPVTIIETPPMHIIAFRAYFQDFSGLQTLTEVYSKSLPKEFKRIKSISEKTDSEKNLKKIEENIDRIVEFRALCATQTRLVSTPKKKPDLMENKIGGGSINEQFEYLKKGLGKEVSVNNIFQEGQFLDVVAVTKGKGWQGVVKRWHVRILQHKANKTKRGIATLGPWKPPRVRYTVPRAGQMGYHQRTEYNKYLLKIGKEGKDVTPKGGFLRYGNVKNSYLMLKGSVPGPAKRLIRLRYAARQPNNFDGSLPQITYISTESMQGHK